MKDNYVLSGLWLVATVGGLGYAGINATLKTRAESQVAAQAAVKEEMKHAVMAGNQGRYADAARMLEALQARYPASTSIALNLGIAYSAIEMYDDADKQFDKVLAKNPQDWDAVAERATLNVARGDEKAGLDILETIPKGEGRLDMRLQADPVWLGVSDVERLHALRDKHGVGSRGDTAVRRLQEMEKRRREFEAANKGASTPPGQAPAGKTP